MSGFWSFHTPIDTDAAVRKAVAEIAEHPDVKRLGVFTIQHYDIMQRAQAAAQESVNANTVEAPDGRRAVPLPRVNL